MATGIAGAREGARGDGRSQAPTVVSLGGNRVKGHSRPCAYGPAALPFPRHSALSYTIAPADRFLRLISRSAPDPVLDRMQRVASSLTSVLAMHSLAEPPLSALLLFDANLLFLSQRDILPIHIQTSQPQRQPRRDSSAL